MLLMCISVCNNKQDFNWFNTNGLQKNGIVSPSMTRGWITAFTLLYPVYPSLKRSSLNRERRRFFVENSTDCWAQKKTLDLLHWRVRLNYSCLWTKPQCMPSIACEPSNRWAVFPQRGNVHRCLCLLASSSLQVLRLLGHSDPSRRLN